MSMKLVSASNPNELPEMPQFDKNCTYVFCEIPPNFRQDDYLVPISGNREQFPYYDKSYNALRLFMKENDAFHKNKDFFMCYRLNNGQYFLFVSFILNGRDAAELFALTQKQGEAIIMDALTGKYTYVQESFAFEHLVRANHKEYNGLFRAVQSGWYDGGFTLDLDGKPFQHHNDDTYLVGVNNCERNYVLPPTQDQVEGFAKDYFDLLEHPKIYLGGWYDNYYCLDISISIDGLEAAMLFAKAQKQDYIYHLHTGKEISVQDNEEKVVFLANW